MPARAGLFEDIDAMEPDLFASHLSDDVRFKFGNGDVVVGRDAVRDVWRDFCNSVAGVRHDLIAQWDTGDAVIAESDVTYTRADSSRVTVPVVTIYRGADLIDDYRVFIDLAPLFADA
jgi:hypothetical protein